MYSEVARTLSESLPGFTDPRGARRSFDAIEAAWHQDDAEPVDPSHLTDLMPVYIDHAMLIGACLMYRLLKGGAR